MKAKYISTILIVLTVLAAGSPVRAQKKKAGKPMTEIGTQVVGQDGKPIGDVRITVDEGVSETRTNRLGEFRLKVPATATLVFEADGYETRHMAVSALKTGEKVVLDKSILFAGGKDRVEIPFRTVPRRNIVGAVSVVTEEDLSGSNDLNPLNILAGKAAGLNVTRIPAEPGRSATKIDIRGLSRSASDNDPLIMIDGIERPLEDLLPEEIESVSVLKDATAKILYGPKAANGVLLVKTKRGKAYKRDRRISLEFGAQTPDRMPEYLNAAEYALLYNQARINDGLAPYYSQAAIDGYRSGNNPVLYPDVDFHKLCLNDHMTYRKAVAQFRGGNQSAQYYVNAAYAGYGGYEAVGNGNTSNKFNIRVNLDYRINDWLKAFVDLSGRMEFFTTNYLQADGLYSRLATHRPNAYPVRWNDPVTGEEYFGASDQANFSSSNQNLYAEMLLGGMRENTVRKGQTNIGADLNLDKYVKGLTAKGYVTFDTYNYISVGKDENFVSWRPLFSAATSGQAEPVGAEQMTVEKKVSDKKTLSDNTYRNYGYFGQISYDRIFGRIHQFTSDLIYFQSKRENPGFSQDDVNRTLALRANYIYRNKWIVELDMAMMGSSRFVKSKRYGYFPTAGIAWILSEENFLKNSDKVNFLKLKASTGILGTDQYIGYYQFENRWDHSGSVNFGPKPEETVNTSTLVNVGNPGLTWEKSFEINVGAEAVLFDRLTVDINYFNNLRYDILTPTSAFSTVNGGGIMYRNYGKIRNRGIEIGLVYSGKAGDFSYSVGGNMLWSKAVNVIADDREGLPESRKQQGKPVDTRFGLVADGLFRHADEIAGYPVQNFGAVQAGDVRYADTNGDRRIDENDITAIGNEYPRFQFGLNVKLAYKGFELSLSGSGKAGYDIYMNNSYFWVRGEQKYSAFVRNYFDPNTGSGSYPRLTSQQSQNNYRSSTLWLKSGNFFKLRDVMLSYTIPAHMTERMNIKQIKLFVRGSNLLTLSSFKDLDPEYVDAGVMGYPYFRAFTGGIGVVF